MYGSTHLVSFINLVQAKQSVDKHMAPHSGGNTSGQDPAV